MWCICVPHLCMCVMYLRKWTIFCRGGGSASNIQVWRGTDIGNDKDDNDDDDDDGDGDGDDDDDDDDDDV